VYLVDIGNRFAHIFHDNSVVDVSYDELFLKYTNKDIYYINVNPNLTNKLMSISNWVDLAPFIKIDGEYEGMGVDRKALLLSRGDGIYIDAGSAITIDIKENNKFIGGTILPGIWRVKSCYEDISPRLKIDNLSSVDLNTLPKTTKDALNYGIIAPIIFLVKSINKKDFDIYCTGGDGNILASNLDAKYDKFLVFEGMKKVIKEYLC